ncbi:hypothetical protein KY495_09820 [Massilia sp. PAMC28688]|uniref:hypothetical protein n=1 Tax=Massilia sp. PAMC28688 TaxID=2861283 RepID=UPI001C62A5F0|nr:hypothetical protein [Massilia sp. PAMC28688]QYF95416.1 hypothetical protein KY495_09820 [Massilia sp. PAMC28688]
MTKYNADYAFILKNIDVDGFPILKADTSTAKRFYQSDPLAAGSAPLIFSNGFQALFAKRGIKEKRADVLFDGATFIVRNHIRTALLALELPTINLHPAVYTDGEGRRHADYWYVAFPGFIDCVDRAKSRYMPPLYPDDTLAMGAYSLDDAVLDKIPLQQRLLFRMGGTDDGLVVCHCSLFNHFRDDGVLITMIADY